MKRANERIDKICIKYERGKEELLGSDKPLAVANDQTLPSL